MATGEKRSNEPIDPNRRAPTEQDPLLQSLGSGKHLWADEHADEYVARLREGW